MDTNHPIDWISTASVICVPNLIGNLANWPAIHKFAQENNLRVVEDSADTIGYSTKTKDQNWADDD